MQAKPLVLAGDAASLMDPSLDCLPEAILQLAELAFRCLAMPTSLRPQMRAVVVNLETAKSKYSDGEAKTWAETV